MIVSGGYWKNHRGEWERFEAPEVGEGEERPPVEWKTIVERFMAIAPAQTPKENIMLTVRAKFRCTLKEDRGENGFKLGFDVVTFGSEENQQFFKYTPGGHVGMDVVNPTAAAAFELGKEYYLDFTPAVVVDESKPAG